MDSLHKALEYLSRREHSRFELDQKLKKLGVEAAARQEVLDHVASKGYQSDRRFCEAYVHSRSQRGVGPLRLSAELKQRQVAEDLIDYYLYAQAIDWGAQAARARCKKFGKSVPKDVPSKMKQMRFLHYRGFASEHINQCLVMDD